MQTMSQITEAAKRIAKAHNECGGNLVGGKLAFDADGQGGEWYSADSSIEGRAHTVFAVRAERVTAAEVQAALDADAEFRDSEYGQEVARYRARHE